MCACTKCPHKLCLYACAQIAFTNCVCMHVLRLPSQTVFVRMCSDCLHKLCLYACAQIAFTNCVCTHVLRLPSQTVFVRMCSDCLHKLCLYACAQIAFITGRSEPSRNGTIANLAQAGMHSLTSSTFLSERTAVVKYK